MTQKTLILLAFLAFALSPAYGQTDKQEPQPASQQDVKRLQQELIRMRREAQKAEENAAKRSESERKSIIEENQAALKAAEEKLQESIEREARRAEEESRMRTMRITRLVLGTIVGLVLIGGTLFLVLLYRKKATLEKSLVNPDLATLRKIAVTKPDKKVKFILELEGGRRFICEVFFENLNNQPQVRFVESGKTCRWDRRKETAESLKPRVA
jgi:hypothetical protein